MGTGPHRLGVAQPVTDPGRVEIWFKPANAPCLPSLLEGIEIRGGESYTDGVRTAVG